MEKNTMYFEVHKAKIYKKEYRPSGSIVRFVKSLLSVILIGESPISGQSSHIIKKIK